MIDNLDSLSSDTIIEPCLKCKSNNLKVVYRPPEKMYLLKEKQTITTENSSCAIICQDCGCQLNYNGGTLDELIENWNRRQKRMTVAEVIKKLQGMDQNKIVELWVGLAVSDDLYISEDLSRNKVRIWG